MPFYAIYTIADFCLLLDQVFCKVWFVCNFTFCAESALTLLLLSYDRLLLVKFGDRYSIKVTKKWTLIKIALSWIIAFTVYGPAIIVWGVFEGSSGFTAENGNLTYGTGNSTTENGSSGVGCLKCDLELAQCPEYTLVTSFIECVVPFKGLLIINGVIYYKIRGLISKNAKNGREIKRRKGNDTKDTTLDDDFKTSYIQTDKKNVPKLEGLGIPNTGYQQNESLESISSECKNASNIDVIEENDKLETNLITEDASVTNRGDTCIKRHTEEDSDSIMRHVEETSDDMESRNVEQDSDEILISVLGVMERHGSGILRSKSLKRQQESSPRQSLQVVMQNNESASNIKSTATTSNDEAVGATSSSYELTNTLRKRLSNYASKVICARNEADDVTLETLTENQTSIHQEAEHTKESFREVNVDSAINERKYSELASAIELTISRIRQSRKAASFLIGLVLVFYICWLPYTIVTIIISFCTECVGFTAYEILTWLLWVKSAVNPFLYAYNSSRYRYNFKRFLTCCKANSISEASETSQ